MDFTSTPDSCIWDLSPMRLGAAKEARESAKCKSSQLFIRTHNETLSVVAVRINNPNCSPLRINGRDVAVTPTGFLEVVGDYFPVLHAADSAFLLSTRQ